jgi:hypothetical protein
LVNDQAKASVSPTNEYFDRNTIIATYEIEAVYSIIFTTFPNPNVHTIVAGFTPTLSSPLYGSITVQAMLLIFVLRD